MPVLLGGRDVLFSTLQLSAKTYFSIFALTAAGWALRAAKQGLLMRRLGVHAGIVRVFAISQATEFAFLATPGGVGGYAAGIWYLRSAGASYAAATAIAAADQVLDLVFFAAAIPFALLFLVDAPEIGMLRELARISGALTAFVVLGLFLARRRLDAWLFGADMATGWIERLPFLRKRRVELRGFVANLRVQTRALTNSPFAWQAALWVCTALQWLARYAVLWLILRVLGEPVPYALLFLLQGLVLHAAQWTGVPAGAGGADLGLAASLVAFVSAPTLAAALLLWRGATLYLSLGAGIAAIVTLRARSRASHATSETAQFGNSQIESTTIAGTLRARQ